MKHPSLLLFALLSITSLRAADWEPVSVPGSWEEKGPASAQSYDGVAWYRTWVKVPDNFFSRHERNLWEESISVNIRDLADAHETYVNGVNIGAGGRFPPDFRSGRELIHRHKVPVGTLQKGKWNEIAIRVYNRTGPGGFLGEPPFIMTYNIEVLLEGKWEFLVGDGYKPGGALSEKPATSSFEKSGPSNRVLGRAAQLTTGPKLPPEESHAQMTWADDLQVDLILAEPLVAQGTHMSFDERGRLWVTQYRQYPYPAGLEMVSRDMYYRAHYDRVPPAPPNHDRGADVISIHEDTDGDGRFDRHKVFQDGLNMANSAVRGADGVWVMNPPYLMYYPDADFDDVPDGPPVVHLQGFGLEDTHSVANGLVWGPDGWLYGVTGSTSSSRVTRPRLDPEDSPGVYFEGCMLWRYHPETREYDLFSEGSANPFGLELDGEGRLYSGINSGESRGWHYVQGGFYLMQGVSPSKFGPPRNPYAFGDLPKMATLTPVRRFSHFGAFAEGTAMPAKYQGHLIALDPLHNEIIDVERIPAGATFETRDLGVIVKSKDVAFRPIYIVNAPDGSLYVSDMYEYYIAHGQHYQSQIDPSTGRIYRVRGENLPLEKDTNLSAKTGEELVALLAHPNKWHRLTAVRVLAERQDRKVVPLLQRKLAEDDGHGALGALWVLHQLKALDDATARSAFEHSYPEVRMWAVRLVGDKYGINRGLGAPGIGAPDARNLTPETMAALSDLTRRELNLEVRAQIASTARRLVTPQALALASLLATRTSPMTDRPVDEIRSPALAATPASADADVNDPYVPLLIWWILEAHVKLDREAVLAMFEPDAFWDQPMVKEHLLQRIMKRFALEGRRQDLLVAARLLRMAPTPAHAGILIEGFGEAYRGREMAGLPDELLQAMADSGQSPLVLRVRQGERKAIQEALSALRNGKAPVEDRILYARIFGEVRTNDAVPALLSIAAGKEPEALRKAALVALMMYDQPDIGPWAAAQLPKTSGDVQTAFLALMASRASWSADLLRAVETGKIAGSAIPPDIVARIRAHQDEAVTKLAARIFPRAPAEEGTNAKQRLAEVEAALKGGSGNPYAGEKLYSERCASCHKLFFKGGKIGPELTYYQRDNLGTMLPSILTPSVEIREGFEYTMVETTDGRSLSGFVIERDPQVVVLRGLAGADITLRLSEIKEMRPMGRSLMPDGLIDDLDDQQLRDLFAYLRITQPIAK